MSRAKGHPISGDAPHGLLDMPFDRYQQHSAVADVLGCLRRGDAPLSILGIGGGSSALQSFLVGDEFTAFEETGTEGRPGPPTDPATPESPVRDGAFDYVVGIDVLDGLEPEDRHRYLSVLRRVAGKGVLLSGAFDSAVVRDARRITDEVRRALNLEREEGAEALPALDNVKCAFEEQGDTVFVLPNGYVPHWLAMTSLSLYGAAHGDELGDLSRQVNAFYNEFVCGSDNSEPSYRHLLVCLKRDAGADLDGLLPRAPDSGRAARDLDLSGALFATLPLTAEVGRLNAQIAEKQGELTRKEVQVDDLFGRLAGLVSAENAHRVHHNNLLRMNENTKKANVDLTSQNVHLRSQKNELQRQLDRITGSRTWRLLTLLRRIRLRISGSG